MNVPIQYALSTQICIYYICSIAFYVLETQMHTMLQSASFTIQIYLPDTCPRDTFMNLRIKYVQRTQQLFNTSILFCRCRSPHSLSARSKWAFIFVKFLELHISSSR